MKWTKVEDDLPELFEEVLLMGKERIIFSGWLQPDQGGYPINWMLWGRAVMGGVTQWTRDFERPE